jgi:hypothetical protein
MQPVAIGISSATNVRFGSLADISLGHCDVRFTPKSGYGPGSRSLPDCSQLKMLLVEWPAPEIKFAVN